MNGHFQIFKLPVKLPIWARWAAIDEFGVLVAFENKPEVQHDLGLWQAVGRHKDVLAYCSQSFREWKTSLRSLRSFAVKNSLRVNSRNSHKTKKESA